MIIDSHNHMGIRKGENFPTDSMLQWMDDAGVDAAVVTTHPEAIDNEYIAQAQKDHPSRIIGFAVVNPWDYSAEEELEHCFRDLHLYGLKLNPLRHGYALDRHEIMDSIFTICQKYKKPILVHGLSDQFNMPGKFEEMAKSFPDVKIIMAHIGEPDAVDWAIRVAARNKNIYVDTAGIILNTLKAALKGLPPEKIFMGTDAPWGNFELSIKLVEKATSDEHIRSMIMGGNIAKLLDLPVKET